MRYDDDDLLIDEDEEVVESPTIKRMREKQAIEKVEASKRADQHRRIIAETKVLKAIVRRGVYWPGDL